LELGTWNLKLDRLIEGAIEVYPTAAGETASRLAWLWPDAASLAALTQPLSAAIWPAIRRDPGALLLLFGHGADHAHSPQRPLLSPIPQVPTFALRSALLFLERDEGGWVDWRHAETLPVYRCALTTAHFARLLAGYTRRCDPETAFAAGMLAPLGWFAVAGADPDALGACLGDPRFESDPLPVQQAAWGADHGAIARRLARRWLLPGWLRVAVGHLNLPVSAAAELGADAGLFAVVQLAVQLGEAYESPLGLSVGVDRTDALRHLDLCADDLAAVRARFAEIDVAADLAEERADPRQFSGLRDRLRRASEQTHRPLAINRSLENDVDRLHRLLVEQRAAEEERVRSEKLAALAEFAAGASHEINNPLAVISGQSQYLLQAEGDEGRQKALASIVRQVQRIHGILTELMQFARPARPHKQPQRLGGLLKASVEELRAAAEERAVAVSCDDADPALSVFGDGPQLQTALACLVRNAVQAAPGGGWVRVFCDGARDGRVDVVVEDNGPGPSPAQQRHMFDPFFSGRSAGRGRGLGLPTAWRLAREHGGDVRFEPRPDGPTRFVLSLPCLIGERPERLSA
jgi:signal transduction histidine kinase